MSQYYNERFTVEQAEKTIQVSPFQAHFGRLPKTEFKIVRDRFLNNSDYLDKQHLERSALTASQLKRRIDQSRENLKIVRKGQLSRDTSPLHKQQLTSDRDKERAKALKELLEANACWNYERRDAAKNDIRKLVDETATQSRPSKGNDLLLGERICGGQSRKSTQITTQDNTSKGSTKEKRTSLNQTTKSENRFRNGLNN